MSSRLDNVVQSLDTVVVNLAFGDLLVCVVTMTTEILFVAAEHVSRAGAVEISAHRSRQ